MIGILKNRDKTALLNKFTSVRLSVKLLVGVGLAVFASAPGALAIVVTDDFSDLNDTVNPTWTRLNGAAMSTGQTWDASTGQYHLVAPANGTHELFPGYSFVGAYTGPSFTDVRVTTDFVDFTPTDPAGTIMGVAARLDGDNRSWGNLSDPMQGLKGYGYMYEANADSGRGEMVLTLLWAGAYKDIGSQKVTLDNTNDYRFVLEVIGTTLHGQVYNLGPSEAPLPEPVLVAEDFRDVVTEPVMIDHDLTPSTPDAAHEPYTSGFSGVWGIGHVFYRDADYTLDNFRTETAVAGDYNRDGSTDAADYVLWRKTLGETGPTGNPPTAFGDLRANGSIHPCDQCQVIDEADYNVWQANFGTSFATGGTALAAAAPEPAGAVLLLIAAASLGLGGKRRR